MKRKITIIFTLCLLTSMSAFSNGVCILNASEGVYFELLSSEVQVEVSDQIATITTTQYFLNDFGDWATINYAFPMTETASALSLRWKNGGIWFEAEFQPSPQDTTLPGAGGGIQLDPGLDAYLGDNRLYFDLLQSVAPGDTLIVELKYVDLLPYNLSKVNFYYPNDYSLIQDSPIDVQHFLFELSAQRTIESIDLLQYPGSNSPISSNDGQSATLEYTLLNAPADENYELEYAFAADELGMFGYSTLLPDTLDFCDSLGRGFVTLIVEPDAGDDTEIINKVFSLIIDRSGSMEGNKIQQAREAASFIVENLNAGDYFNVTVFDGDINSIWSDHVLATASSQNTALDFIADIYANGSTNISGAFSEVIPMYQNNDPNLANIIIFFTDGQASSGITDTPGILDHVQGLISSNGVNNLGIYTFGIGSDANTQLLNQLATQNNGLFENLASADLFDVISTFYLTIQNPVLLYPQVSFDPPLIYETYPVDLPNLYKGQQLIIVGRYSEAGEVDVLFEGEAFGMPVSYEYTIDLSPEEIPNNAFLPKLWAKKKLEHLTNTFYQFDHGSPEGVALEDSITAMSICYGVLSPLTSFGDGTGGGPLQETTEIEIAGKEIQISARPNPFTYSVQFKIEGPVLPQQTIRIEIYDPLGRLIKILNVEPNGNRFIAEWDGTDAYGNTLPKGVYFCRFLIGDEQISLEILKD